MDAYSDEVGARGTEVVRLRADTVNPLELVLYVGEERADGVGAYTVLDPRQVLSLRDSLNAYLKLPLSDLFEKVRG